MRGDIVSITDGTDTIQAQYSYDPWGTPTSYMGTMTQPLRYAGYYLDEETGLYYLKSRYYSPEIGRFITEDGYGYIKYSNPQTLNLYGYCGNNPVNTTDPFGHWQEGDEKLSYIAQTIIIAAGEDWLEAYQNGDQAGMDAAHARAETARAIGQFSFEGMIHKPGYGDINATAIGPYFIGVSSGVMTDNLGNHPYGGVALGLPGYSMSGTGSTQYTVTEGLNAAVQGQLLGVAGQAGLSSSGVYWEVGGGAGSTPINGSIVIFHVK